MESMNARWKRYLCKSLLVTFTIVVGAIWVQAQTSSVADEAAIRKHLSGYADARRTGDGHAQSLFFTDDADEWGLSPRMRKGRAQLEQGLNISPEQTRQFKLEITNVGFLRPDVALVDALYYGAATDPAGHAFYLLIKHSGRWLIRSSRITRFPIQTQ
jgi:uncharacterized protein (TIGR02246 family)